MDQSSFYDQLGLPPDATQEEIRHAYRQHVLRLHPDINVNRGETELFIDIQSAYEHLSDPQKKAEYDKKLPMADVGTSPLNVKIIYSQPSLIRLTEAQLVYALVELFLHPDTALLVNSTPLNISLVVDCSTSMKGIRLDTVKQTAIELIRHLQPKDIFSLVKFNDRAELLIPSGALSDIKSTEMKVQLLQAGGGTEIYKGLEMAFSQVSQCRSNNRVNHIILITDGRTYGDEENCKILAEQASALGIGISALGIGTKWNDAFLDHITSQTGGICKYISQMSDIRDSLLDEISRLGSSLTEQITFNFTASQKIELNNAFRINPDAAPLVLGSPLIFGSIPRRGAMSILFEFLIKEVPAKSGPITLAKGFLDYRVPRHPVKTHYVQRLTFERPVGSYQTFQSPPAEILNAIMVLSLYQMQDRARSEMKNGDIISATRHLQILATHLYQKGEDRLAQSILDEVTYIQEYQTFSEDGEKRLKYGTRSLLLPARTEER
jgi:Ca-activated chloride channel homolog